MKKGNSTALVRRTSSLPALLGRELPKYFTREEVHQILEATKNERDKLMLTLLWQTGLRVSELLSLKPALLHKSVTKAVLSPSLPHLSKHLLLLPSNSPPYNSSHLQHPVQNPYPHPYLTFPSFPTPCPYPIAKYPLQP